MNKLLSVLVLIIFYTNYLYTQADYSLTYIDLIARLNQNIKCSQNDFLAITQDLPIKLDSVKKIREQTFLYNYTSKVEFDTTITFREKAYNLMKGATRIITYSTLTNSKAETVITDSLFFKDHSEIKKLFYQGDIPLGGIAGNQKLDYAYFDNGQLKEIKKGNAKFI